MKNDKWDTTFCITLPIVISLDNKMPSAALDSHGILGVAAADTLLDKLLERAESVKQSQSIEPPLDESDFPDIRRQLSDALGHELASEDPNRKTRRFALIETAVRDTFKSLIVSLRLAGQWMTQTLTHSTSVGNNTDRRPGVRKSMEPL